MLGFRPSKGDTSLFFFKNHNVTMYMLVYVDDIIVTSSYQQANDALLAHLEKDFTLKDLRDLHYFLDIEVTKTDDGILLSQSKYATYLLKKTGMNACKPVCIPLSTSEKYSAHVGTPLGLVDTTNYYNIVGKL
jgi:hypothetical protein